MNNNAWKDQFIKNTMRVFVYNCKQNTEGQCGTLI